MEHTPVVRDKRGPGRPGDLSDRALLQSPLEDLLTKKAGSGRLDHAARVKPHQRARPVEDWGIERATKPCPDEPRFPSQILISSALNLSGRASTTTVGVSLLAPSARRRIK